MGREVRRVPADWKHPKGRDNRYEPLFDTDYETEAKAWMEAAILWHCGKHPDQQESCQFYWEWHGKPPSEELYRPAWLGEDRTHLQMYETVSEGTPISPVMRTAEELAHWLADNGASAFADRTATYEQWLATIERGWAVSAVGTVGGELRSGVEAMEEFDK